MKMENPGLRMWTFLIRISRAPAPALGSVFTTSSPGGSKHSAGGEPHELGDGDLAKVSVFPVLGSPLQAGCLGL